MYIAYLLFCGSRVFYVYVRVDENLYEIYVPLIVVYPFKANFEN